MAEEETPLTEQEEQPEAPETNEEPEVEEQEDPGQLEGLPKVEPKDSLTVQKRIDKLTAKFRAEERRRQDNEKKLTELQEQYKRDIDLMRQHNQQVIEAVKAGQPKTQAPDEVAELTAKVKELKVQRAKALKEMDLDTTIDLDEKIDALKDSIYDKKLAITRTTTEKEVSQRVSEQSIKATAQQFINSVPWIRVPTPDNPNPDYHPGMEGAAVSYEKYLSSLPEWQGKNYSDLLAEVRRKVEEDYGYGKPKPKPPTVAGVGTSSVNGTPASFKLSDDERHVATMMFPDMAPREAEKKYYNQKVGRV